MSTTATNLCKSKEQLKLSTFQDSELYKSRMLDIKKYWRRNIVSEH